MTKNFSVKKPAKPRYSEAAILQRRQKNLGNWLAAATRKHQSTFDYIVAKAQYRTQKSPKVTLYCNRHEKEFSVTPHDHLRYDGGGCPECEHQARSLSKFEVQAAKFHAWFVEHAADRLELISPFRGMTKEITVRCKVHLRNEATKPTYLMVAGSFGCAVCARQAVGEASRLSEASIRQELDPLMPDGIKIRRVHFDSQMGATRIEVECSKHGLFIVAAAYLRKSAYKCPSCGNEQCGYAESRIRSLLATGVKGVETTLGVMEVEVYGVRTLKVGISRRGLEQRYRWDLRSIYFSTVLNELDALLLETKVHNHFVSHRDDRLMKAGMRNKKRWAGDTECYRFNTKKLIIDFLNQELKKIRLDLNRDYWREFDGLAFPLPPNLDIGREKDYSNKPRAVICIDTLEQFPSIASAGRAKGVSHGNLSVALAGTRRMCGGFRWAYLEDWANQTVAPLRNKKTSAKSVRCIETGEVFNSLTAAAAKTGASDAHISSVCKGKRQRAGGYTWEYTTPIATDPVTGG